MSSSTAMDQIAKYWGMWGARKSSSGSSTASPVPAWAAEASSEPSWEEQAFARDAAAHLGGCVWPPRSYSCTFCQREFRSAQALGGHMNVHRRDRALLRQGGSSPEDVYGTPSDQPQQGALYCRSASTDAGIIPVGSAAKGDAKNITTPPTSYLSTIIKESKNKIFSMEMREDQAIDQCDHDDYCHSEEQPARTKRRRLDHHPSAAALLIFVQPMAAGATKLTACEPSQGFQLQGFDRDAKVPSPSSVSPLVDQQEVDLELRLGTTPKVT